MDILQIINQYCSRSFSRKGELLEYIPVREAGPAHKRIFTVEARLNNNVIGVGTAGSKREAEQIAAREALSLFGNNT